MADRGEGLPTQIDRVVEGGYCVGCGSCAAVLGPAGRMALDRYGCYRPDVAEGERQAGSGVPLWDVCPFAGGSAAEDAIAGALFGDECDRDEAIGYHTATYAGSVAEGAFRSRGSSGGMASWVLCELMRRDRIDAVVHVRPQLPSQGDGRLFRYAVSRSADEVLAGAKSRYYPVEMSEVLREVRQTPGRYAFVGLPCFVKAVRLLCGADPVVAERVRYCIGLVCGHLKSTRFADMFAWQCGIEPGAVRAIDFRVKLPGCKAYEYGVEVVGVQDGREARVLRPSAGLFGSSWSYGLLKLPACDFCDDVFAETADLTVGDAWLDPYTADWRGTNVVVVRHRELASLIEAARAERRLALEAVPAAQVARSQEAGLRHRRDGTRYRLFLKGREGKWHPAKRVQASKRHVSRKRRRILELRARLAAESHKAFLEAVEAGQLEVFTERMTPLLTAYDRCYRTRGGLRRLLSRTGKSLLKVLRRRPRGAQAPRASGDTPQR